jgi:hypothetical protein
MGIVPATGTVICVQVLDHAVRREKWIILGPRSTVQVPFPGSNI